ncbi:MAG: hypothetical protein ACE5KG_02305 [Nitrososphaerales archaeon]
MSKEFPQWIAEEISKANIKHVDTIKSTGYILDINEKERKMDVQFYEKLPNGGYITLIELKDPFNSKNFKVGIAYSFELKVHTADLSQKVQDFLKENYSIQMADFYNFELVSCEELKETPEEIPQDEELDLSTLKLDDD